MMKVQSQTLTMLETYENDPVAWAESVLGVRLWSMQREILESVFENRKTVVRSCHSTGKTFVAAVTVLAFLFLRQPCKIITTAPGWRQVKDLLWSEINYLFKTRLQEGVTKHPGRILKTRLEIEDDWFAAGISSKDAVNFQGFHQENVLVVFDEAPGVRQAVYEGADSLGASGNVHFLWIGNPTEAAGPFYKAFSDPTVKGKYHIGYKNTPNFTGEKLPEHIKKELISETYVEEKRNEWGETSPLYMSRVLGDFPDSTPDQIISLKSCEEAATRDVLPEGEKELGVDVGAGGDLSAYSIKHGNVITEVITESTPEPSQIEGSIVALHNKHHFKVIKIDKTGIGWGVVGHLKDLGLPVVGIGSSGDARDKEQYQNKRTEMWFNMRDWLRHGRIPNDDNLFADLIAPKSIPNPTTGRLQVEKKIDTKKRIGHSPDRGDSCIYAIQNESAKDDVFFAVVGN